jgi:hypothetical protein
MCAEAAIDRTLLIRVSDRVAAHGLPPDQGAELLAPAVRLAEQDLPGELVLHKALEGLAKNVPPARIHSVLGQIEVNSEQSGRFVEAWMNRPEVQEALGGEDGRGNEASERATKRQLTESMVQARMNEVSHAVLEKLLTELPARTSRRPISPGAVATILRVLPDLPADVRHNNSASALLTAALDAGYAAEAVRQLPSAMRTAIGQTRRPADALAHAATRQISRGAPAADVLGSLFRGHVPGGPPGARGGEPPVNDPPGQGKSPEVGSDRGQGPPGDDRPGGGPPGDDPPNDGPSENGPPGQENGPSNGSPGQEGGR